ncbi:MAG: hypothetical protein GY930_02360 [bacterium]|nr:hypothetical protein [bacterium]
MSPNWQAPLALAVTLVATPLLAQGCLRAGFLTDSRVLGERWRKPREQAVPLIGGVAVLVGLAVGGVSMPWAALLAAFLLGTWDDLRPLSAGIKLVGQVLAGFLLVRAVGWSGWEVPLGICGAVVAQNAMNTWDHADGLCAGLMGVALPPVLAAPFLGFLPWNVLLTRKSGDTGAPGVPWAYLGDAGSHLAGILMIWYEPARPLLILPLLDLLRVVWLRVRAGQRFWKGDRRHLGHRLLDAGLRSKEAALLALVPCLPLAATAHLGLEIAALACLALLAALVWYTTPACRTNNGQESDEL